MGYFTLKKENIEDPQAAFVYAGYIYIYLQHYKLKWDFLFALQLHLK